MTRVVIIVPTYNEKDNITKLVDAVTPIVSSNKNEILLLVVDGNSPDGTADIVRKNQMSHSWIHLLVETKKEGLGIAYTKGMRYAMKELTADYLMEFDADFQHDPNDIPRLIAEIDNGYDYIVGSRYIPDGAIPKDWSFERKFISVVGNWIARTVLFLPSIHDVTGGFKLARVNKFMDRFDFETLLSKGFAYKIQLFFYMVRKGARVKEVPIKFGHRIRGESKIPRNESIETLRVIFILQYQYLTNRKKNLPWEISI